MKRKLKFLGFSVLVVGAITAIYILGFHNGQMGQEFSLSSEAAAAGGTIDKLADNSKPRSGVLAELPELGLRILVPVERGDPGIEGYTLCCPFSGGHNSGHNKGVRFCPRKSVEDQ